jgi:hypothetical protein
MFHEETSYHEPFLRKFTKMCYIYYQKNYDGKILTE